MTRTTKFERRVPCSVTEGVSLKPWSTSEKTSSASYAPITTRDIDSSADAVLYHKGLHLVNVTGNEVKFYMLEEDIDKAAAFEDYLSAYLDEPELFRRDWYGCQLDGSGRLHQYSRLQESRHLLL